MILKLKWSCAVKGSAQLTVSLDLQEYIQVGSRGVALCRVFDLKLSGKQS